MRKNTESVFLLMTRQLVTNTTRGKFEQSLSVRINYQQIQMNFFVDDITATLKRDISEKARSDI